MTKDTALVSVIIVSRDRPALLDRALKSVFEQDYRPIEIVLLDNQSVTPIEPPAAPPGVTVTVLRSPFFMNASQSRNFALSKASGAFLGLLDDDDYYYPGKIRKQVEALNRDPDAAFSYMDTEIRKGDSVILSRHQSPGDMEALLLYRSVHLNSLLMRPNVIKHVRFDERMTMYVDVHFVFRLFEQFKPAPVLELGAVWNRDDRTDQITQTGTLEKLADVSSRRKNWRILCGDFAPLINGAKVLRNFYYRKQFMLSLLSLRLFEALHFLLCWVGIQDHEAKKSLGLSCS